MGNSSNAYITKRANAVDPSEWINKQQEISQYYEEVERKKEADETARQDKLRKEFKDDFEGEFDLSSMGNDTVNKVFMPMAMQSLQDLKSAKDEGESALKEYGINSKEYRAAKSKYDNILKRPAMFKMAFEGTSTKLNEYNKLVSEGKIHQTPENLKKLQDLTSQPIKYKQDAEGNYIMQQGENVYKMDEFANKLDLGKPIQKVNEGSIIAGITESIGEKEYDQISGYTTTTNTNPWDDYKNPNGEKMPGIKSLLTKGFETSLTDDVMESILAGRGEFEYDKFLDRAKKGDQKAKDVIEDLKAGIVNEWLEIGRGQMEEKFKTSFNSSKYSTDSSRTKSTGSGKTTDDSSPLTKNRVRPTQSVWGDKIKNIDAGNRFSVQPAKTVQIGNRTELQLPTINTIKDLESGKEYSNATIESYTFDNMGNLMTKISYIEDKGGKDIYADGSPNAPESKKTAIVRADADVRRNIANFLEISLDDLWDLAVEKKDDNSSKTETKEKISW